MKNEAMSYMIKIRLYGKMGSTPGNSEGSTFRWP